MSCGAGNFAWQFCLAILPPAAFLGGFFEVWRFFQPGKSRLQPELAAPRFVQNVAYRRVAAL
jgi:hypothetical protein